MIPEGSKDVKLGTPIAILVNEKEDIAKFKNFQAEGAEPAKKEAAP